jgi:hypothetical protein
MNEPAACPYKQRKGFRFQRDAAVPGVTSGLQWEGRLTTGASHNLELKGVMLYLYPASGDRLQALQGDADVP